MKNILCTVDRIDRGLSDLVGILDEYGTLSDSRNGQTQRLMRPVTVQYQNPRNHVLVPTKERLCNPYFHFLESMWMLAGRRDVEFPSKFVKTIAQYSDDGIVFNGAYGYRWRNHFGFDQLKMLAEMLRKDKTTRRAVLTMWEPNDLLKTASGSKDVPCNVSAFFKISKNRHDKDSLDMVVLNRSNDLFWGLLGANVVQFSILQEYMSIVIGVDLGIYQQITNDLHYYATREDVRLYKESGKKYQETYDTGHGYPDYILFQDVDKFDEEVARFIEVTCSSDSGSDMFSDEHFTEPAISKVAVPMFLSHWNYTKGCYSEAIEYAEKIYHPQWRLACRTWLDLKLQKGVKNV